MPWINEVSKRIHPCRALPWFCHELFLLSANESCLYHCTGGDPSWERLKYQEALWLMPSMNRYENKTIQRHLQSRGNLLWGDWVGLMSICPTGNLPTPAPIRAFLYLSLHPSHPALVQLTSLPHHENRLYFPLLVLLSSTDLRRV